MLVHQKEIIWFEVFFTNAEGDIETIFTSTDLERCLKMYRVNKLRHKSTKLDKWLDADYLDAPMSIKCILD